MGGYDVQYIGDEPGNRQPFFAHNHDWHDWLNVNKADTHTSLRKLHEYLQPLSMSHGLEVVAFEA